MFDSGSVSKFNMAIEEKIARTGCVAKIIFKRESSSSAFR